MRRAGAVLLAVAALLAAGCGGDDEPETDAVVAQLVTLCADARADVEALGLPSEAGFKIIRPWANRGTRLAEDIGRLEGAHAGAAGAAQGALAGLRRVLRRAAPRRDDLRADRQPRGVQADGRARERLPRRRRPDREGARRDGVHRPAVPRPLSRPANLAGSSTSHVLVHEGSPRSGVMGVEGSRSSLPGRSGWAKESIIGWPLNLSMRVGRFVSVLRTSSGRVARGGREKDRA